MQTFEEQYLEVLRDVYLTGRGLKDRTGVGCKYKFGHMFRFDVSGNEFPLLTTRKMSDFWLYEFNAFCIERSTNISSLGKYSKIWENWADENGELGPLYGEQMRKQLPALLEQMKDYVLEVEGSEKNARRLCMTMWNVEQLSDMRLTPCHGTVIQFDINRCDLFGSQGCYRLDMYAHQRSADLVLGLPHNIAYYTVLMHYICEYINDYCLVNNINKMIKPQTMNYSLGNYHIYNNQFEGVEEQLHRLPYDVPSIKYNLQNPLESNVKGYKYHPSIKFPSAAV
jgi:thymidylate synthase